ncbi:hypothetical protein INQ40_08490 [Lysobacter sp. H21R4]|uniref:hypothetical protein n=1 Tax=Lysobacter sp. H21R4 TaxID=2781021 RepID=UPI00188876DD|nr:hypothetical protein [Lysobacter sp. H21R4]QOY61992.1 hypothetical protein INQ40_08490 [Lysobacter sp. H21R4]
MMDAFYFGETRRPLFGVLHRPARPIRSPLLMCPPLLQDGIRSHRVLRAIAEGLAGAGAHVMRFDWYGTGDSGGATGELTLAGLLLDLGEALAMLRPLAGRAGCRWLALRSGAIPLLAHASTQFEPVDLVLWDPTLSGEQLVGEWSKQHRKQLLEAGRYPTGHGIAQPDELLGFAVDPGLLSAIATFDAGQVTLPAGSRVTMAAWKPGPAHEGFVERLRSTGVAVECRTFEVDDRPCFEDPHRFETQAYPRRSAAQLVSWLTGGDAP